MYQIRCFAPEEDTRESVGGAVDLFDRIKELCKPVSFVASLAKRPAAC